MAEEQETALRRQLVSLQGQIEDLRKLQSQLEVESQLIDSNFKPIQTPFADLNTLSPHPALRVIVVVLSTLILTGFLVILLQMIRPISLRQNRG